MAPSGEGSRPGAPPAEAEEANPEGLPSVWSALSSYESIRALGIPDIKNWKVRRAGTGCRRRPVPSWTQELPAARPSL